MPRSIKYHKLKRPKTRKYYFRKPKRAKTRRRRRARGRFHDLFKRELTGSHLRVPIESNKKLLRLVEKWINNEKIPKEYGHIRNWNTSKITDMSELFMDEQNFNENINDWDVSNVTNMDGMFEDASSFNKPLDKWHNKLGKVTDMNYMFLNASSFNQDLSSWDITNVANIDKMFDGATEMQEENKPDISEWRDWRDNLH